MQNPENSSVISAIFRAVEKEVPPQMWLSLSKLNYFRDSVKQCRPSLVSSEIIATEEKHYATRESCIEYLYFISLYSVAEKCNTTEFLLFSFALLNDHQNSL